MRDEKGEREEKLEDALRRSLGREPAPRGLEQTVALVRRAVEARAAAPVRPKQSFWGFLSDVFHFEGIPMLLPQLGVLAVTCLIALSSPMGVYDLPMYMPLYILAVMPVFFKGQRYRVSELEAATRTSGAQLALARLILAGGGALMCLTVLLALEVWLRRSFDNLGRVILYCLVPYLTCMTTMLALIRRRRQDGAARCLAFSLGSVVFWRFSARLFPWLYEASAVGVWIGAVVVYACLFAKEIVYIIHANKEVNMYGIIDR